MTSKPSETFYWMDELMQLLVGSWQWQTWTLPESGHANLIWKPNNLHQLAMQLVCSSSHTRSFTPAGGKPMLSIDVVDTSIGAACLVDWQTFFTFAGFEPSTSQATTEGFDPTAAAVPYWHHDILTFGTNSNEPTTCWIDRWPAICISRQLTCRPNLIWQCKIVSLRGSSPSQVFVPCYLGV